MRAAAILLLSRRCGRVNRRVDVFEDHNCGVRRYWREEKEEWARGRMTLADWAKTAGLRFNDDDQRNLGEVTAS
jgi:hypothetical protein